MKWILDNLQLVVIVASAFAWWLTQRKQQNRDPGDEGQAPTLSDETRGGDYDESDRTRRIQEEIRRKIAERYGGGTTVLEPPPEPTSYRPEPPPLVVTAPPARREVQEWGVDDAGALERQRKLAEQMKSLEQARRTTQAHAALLGHTVPRSAASRVGPVAGVGGLTDWRAMLRDRRGLKQAMILREVLGPPVALR